jgi:tetratricopeptide (TPR) repeat protein
MKLIEMLENGEIEEARKAAADALRRAPEDPEAHVVVLKLALLDGDLEKADGLILKLSAKLLPEELAPELLFIRAALAATKDEFSVAFEIYQKAVRQYPQRPEGHYGLGIAYATQSRYEQSLPELRRAVELAPENGLFRYHLAQNLFQLEKTEEAIDQIALSIEKLPTHIPSYVLFSKVLAALGSVEDARKVLKEGLKIMPEEPKLTSELFNVCLACGDQDGALTAATTLAKVYPNDVGAQSNHALLLIAKGKMDEALQICRRMDKLGKATAPLKCIEATAYEARLELDKAARAYEQAMEIDKSDWAAPNNLGQLLLRNSSATIEEVARAVSLFEEAIRRRPAQLEPKLNLALAYLRAGQNARSLELADALLAEPMPVQHSIRMHAERLRQALRH